MPTYAKRATRFTNIALSPPTTRRRSPHWPTSSPLPSSITRPFLLTPRGLNKWAGRRGRERWRVLEGRVSHSRFWGRASHGCSMEKNRAAAELELERNPMPTIVSNALGIVTLWNAKAAITTGYYREEMIGMELAEVVAGDAMKEEVRHSFRSRSAAGTKAGLGLERVDLVGSFFGLRRTPEAPQTCLIRPFLRAGDCGTVEQADQARGGGRGRPLQNGAQNHRQGTARCGVGRVAHGPRSNRRRS